MEKLKPTDAVARIVDVLEPLTPDERQRVMRAAMALVGEPEVPLGRFGGEVTGDGDTVDLPPRARAWVKQNDLTIDRLHQVFHFADGAVEVIASDIPGKNNKEKTHNAYVLEGIAKLLGTGDARFDDKAARTLCNKSGCFDGGNHSTYMKDIGNEITGSKEKGWILTAPGLKHGAALVNKLTE